MLEVLKIFYEILVSPFEVQLLDFFSVWGIVIQTLITLLISSITIWLMIKYGENQKMIGELKNHTMILSKQYEILYEINKPFITIESFSNKYQTKSWCYLTNIGLKLRDLNVDESSPGRVLRPDKLPISLNRNETVNFVLMFEDTMATKVDPYITLSYYDPKGTKYLQTITKHINSELRISSPIEYYLAKKNETT